MNLKTSLFNKMLIKSDLKRFWWVSVLNTLAILVFAVYSRFQRYFFDMQPNVNFLPEVETEFTSSAVYGVLIVCIPILIVFCGFTAVMLSMYLNSASAVSFMHGLPLKRKNHYASHYLSGAILITIPAVVNSVILYFMSFHKILSQYIEGSHILKFLFLYLIYAFLVYSGTTLIAMLTGNAFALVGITCVVAVVPLIAAGFLTTLFSNELYGYFNFDITHWLNYIYIEPSRLLRGYWLIYIAFTVFLTIAAYFVCKVRHLENYGEIVAFRALKKVFVYFAAVVLGILGYLYCVAISDNASLLWILAFGILGVLIAFMLTKRSFSLKGVQKPLAVFACLFVCFFLVLEFDLTGYEKRIPDIEDVEGISLLDAGFDFSEDSGYYPSIGNVKFLETYYPILTETEDKENVIALHKYMIENREKNPDASYIHVPISYKLSNGKEIRRSYRVPVAECGEYLKKIYETEEMKAYNYKLMDDTEKKLLSVSVSDERFEGITLNFFENDSEMLEKLETAFKNDVENLKYEDDYKANSFVADAYTQITFEYYKPFVTDNGEEVSEVLKKQLSRQYTYCINKNYVNTVAILSELGFYDTLPQKGDIKAVGISFYSDDDAYGDVRYKDNYTPVPLSEGLEETLSDYEYKTEDSVLAWELYSLATEEAIYDTNAGNNSVELGFVGKGGIWKCHLYYGNELPEVLTKIRK